MALNKKKTCIICGIGLVENGVCPVCGIRYSDLDGKYNQDIKADAGKPRLTLVPQQIIYDIAKVREYGVGKYGSSEAWKDVEIERYRDAAYRHFLAYLEKPDGVDAESGLPHLSHLACNIAFLCELEKIKKKI